MKKGKGLRLTAVLLLLSLISTGNVVWAEGADDRDRVIVVTAPPYSNVSVLVDSLRQQEYQTTTLNLTGDFGESLKQLRQLERRLGGADLVTVGGAAIPVSHWLDQLEPRTFGGQWVMVGPPGRGAVTAEVLFMQQVLVAVESFRGERHLHRIEAQERWAAPDYRSVTSFVAKRTRLLYEPLYHEFLLSERMSFQGSSAGFLQWLSSRYPARMKQIMTNERLRSLGEVGPASGEGRSVHVSQGYLEYVAVNCARHSYFSQVSPQDSLTRDLLYDVPLDGDLRSGLVRFLQRRGLRFLNDYLVPQLFRRGRWEALEWLAAQYGLDEGVLAYQLPEVVVLPWGDGEITIQGNQQLEAARRKAKPFDAARVVVEAPNWWQLIRADIRANDWWTETASATAMPAGSSQQLFIPVGGRLGQDEQVVEVVLAKLGFTPSFTADRGVWHQVGRLADRTFGVIGAVMTWGRGRPAPDEGPEREMDLSEAVSPPRIYATYQNKSTTLQRPDPHQHDHWIFRYGGDREEILRDPNHLAGDFRLTPKDQDQRVKVASISETGRTLREQDWTFEDEFENGEEEAVITYETSRALEPEIHLEGPVTWVTGRPATYEIRVEVEPPEEVENLSVHFDPGETFEVLWERPGRFTVTGAVNLRYSWRFSDGSSQYYSATFTEAKTVEVLAIGLNSGR